MNLLSDGLQKNLQNEKLKGSEKQNSTTGFTVINPLSPKSDQRQISRCNISALYEN